MIVIDDPELNALHFLAVLGHPFRNDPYFQNATIALRDKIETADSRVFQQELQWLLEWTTERSLMGMLFEAGADDLSLTDVQALFSTTDENAE